MHQSTFEAMRTFRDVYLRDLAGPVRVLDLGAQDVNGCFRSLFEGDAWCYQGLDLCPGKNVDVILADPYRWSEIEDESADVVISGSAFEHIEFFWLTMEQIRRVLKPGGLACIIAPSSGPDHAYPQDCWRFYPDGLVALARYCEFELLKAHTDFEPRKYSDKSEVWKDSTLICRKPDVPGKASVTPHHPLLKRRVARAGREGVHFVCVSHRPEMFKKYLGDNEHLQGYGISLYDNSRENIGIPERYNHFIEHQLAQVGDAWVVFLHHDFEFEADPVQTLSGLDRNNIYGAIGACLQSDPKLRTCVIISKKSRPLFRIVRHRHYLPQVRGEIGCPAQYEYTLGSRRCGTPIAEPVEVDTVDCCCLIVHSSLLRRHPLRFDRRLPWHLYSEDFSLSAREQHQIKTFAVNFHASHHAGTGMNKSFRDHLSRLLVRHPGTDFASTCFSYAFPVQNASDRRGMHLSLNFPLVVLRALFRKLLSAVNG